MAFRPGPPQPPGGGGDWESPKPDTYPAVISAVWPVGIHVDKFQGKAPTAREKAVVSFQLDEQDSKGRPFEVMMKVSVPRYWPSEKATLYNLAVQVLGPRADTITDFWDMVGKPLQVQVRTNEKSGRAEVKGYLGLGRGQTAPPLVVKHHPDKPVGLAKWMLENAISQDEADRVNAEAEKAREATADPEPVPPRGEAEDDVPF